MPNPMNTASRQRLQGLANLASPVKMIDAATKTGGFAAASVRRAVQVRHKYPGVPVPRPTLGKLAMVFAEELMLLHTATREPRVQDEDLLRRISEETDQTLAYFAANGWLDDPVAYYERPDAPTSVDFEPGEFARIKYQRISFDSGYQPRPGMPGAERWLSIESNRRCYAHVMEHPDGPRPWLVLLHGVGMGGPVDLVALRALGFHRDLGYNVIAPVLPLHGPRRHTGPERADVVSLDWVSNVHSLTQIVWDVRRCLAWIRERGASSIAIHGMSLGGYTTALVAGLDSDLDCVIAGVPAATIHRPLMSAYGRDTHPPAGVGEVRPPRGAGRHVALCDHPHDAAVHRPPRTPVHLRRDRRPAGDAEPAVPAVGALGQTEHLLDPAVPRVDRDVRAGSTLRSPRRHHVDEGGAGA